MTGPQTQGPAVSGTFTCKLDDCTAAQASAMVGQTLVFTLQAGYSTPFRARVAEIDVASGGLPRLTLEAINPAHLRGAVVTPGHIWPRTSRTGGARTPDEGPPRDGSNYHWALWLLGRHDELATAVGQISGAITILQDGSVVLELDYLATVVNGVTGHRLTPAEVAPLLLLATLSNVPTPVTLEALGHADDRLVSDWRLLGMLAYQRARNTEPPKDEQGIAAETMTPDPAA